MSARHDTSGLTALCGKAALLGGALSLLVGCGSEVRLRYTLHQDAILTPGRSDTDDLAIAFRLDEYADRDTAIASAAALRDHNFE